MAGTMTAMTRRAVRVPESLMDRGQGMRADYASGKTGSRFMPALRGVNAMGSSDDWHLRNETDYLRMVERSRMIVRDSPIIDQAIGRLVTNILRDPMQLDAETGDKDLDAELTRRWKAWSTNKTHCDASERFTLHTMAWMSLYNRIVDGDILHLPLRDGSIETIENHRLRTPRTKRNVVLGVLIDARRRALEYWIHPEDVLPRTRVERVGDVVRVPARDELGRPRVLHHYFPKRFSRTRGITPLNPIMLTSGMTDDLQFQQLVKANMAASYAIIEEHPEPIVDPIKSASVADDTATGSQSTEQLEDGSERILEKLGPGMTYRGAPGVKLSGFSPQIPNDTYLPFYMNMLSIIAVNLDMPIHVLLLDPTKTNFSGWRGAMEQARKGFARERRNLVEQFYQPIYQLQVDRWLRTDADLRRAAHVTLDGQGQLMPRAGATAVDVFGHRWTPPRDGYIEPTKDIAAANNRLRGNLISPRRQSAEDGYPWEELAPEIVADRGLILRAALTETTEIRKAFADHELPDAVVTQFLLSGELPKNITQGNNGRGRPANPENADRDQGSSNQRAEAKP